MQSTSSTSTLYFNPDLHPDDTLRAFDEFIQTFELRYDAQYPDPPKTSLRLRHHRYHKVPNNVPLHATLLLLCIGNRI